MFSIKLNITLLLVTISRSFLLRSKGKWEVFAISNFKICPSRIFKELKLLKFHDIHSFQLGTFMFSFENSTLPSKFNNFFLLNSQIHNYNTRNAQSFRLPLCRTNTRKFSIYFQGPNFYNSLNSDITSSPSSASFKRKLKEFLLSRY